MCWYIVAEQVTPAAHRCRRLGQIEGVVDEHRGGADLVKTELELGDDAEVATAPAQPPEQVLVLRLADP